MDTNIGDIKAMQKKELNRADRGLPLRHFRCNGCECCCTCDSHRKQREDSA
ncbi:hypothetical protein LCGC14_0861230 [marine sediment metagenome]|uniref:Uncharacterized protein n=1 Tax=marine sediment metagenome TaxID=412755 RepID=A0A0F9SEH9_9ZZZZ